MKILVTGATGFIGNHVVNELLNHDVEIVTTSKISDDVTRNIWHKKVIHIGYDIGIRSDDRNLYEYFQRPDKLIHLSWEGLPNYNKLYHVERNLPSHCQFLKNIIANGLKDVSIIGTCFEYGLINGCLDEQVDTKPCTSYGLAKDTLRKFVELLKDENQFHYKWIRLFYLYGKGQPKTSIIGQLDDALANNEKIFNMSGGEQLRDYLPVERVAEYIVRIALQNNITGIINCCSGKPVSIRSLVEQYVKKNNAEITLNPGYYPYPEYEPMAFWGDDAKLRMILE